MKYSINGTGFIVAERDIYSLGGFIPKGTVGGKIASEAQLSQDGECWLAGGDISNRPDVRIKDNAYIGTFNPSAAAAHTDGVTEFSGNTLIPGVVIVRNPIADPVNNFYAKDSFIGVSMDVLCGPVTTTTAFPFEQGQYNQNAPKGTVFTSATMKLDAANCVRCTATIRQGRDTYLYTPSGYNARVFWAYTDTTGRLAFSGETLSISQALTKLDHPVYRLCMVFFAKAPTLTPAELLASGAKILGHISGSVNTDIRPESASGEYVINNSSFVITTDNFGLATTQLRFVAGGIYDTNLYTKADRQDYKPFGTFRNVERLEYSKYLSDSHRTAANRDTYISAYECPLLRVDDGTYDTSLTSAGDLVLRRCILPKAEFQNDLINGNTYEDIDFSYANEDLGFTMTGYTRFISSHRQGIYRMSGGPSSTGFASHKGNLDPTARLYQAERYIPLDGSIMEQGSYVGTFDTYYEDSKNTAANRVRTGRPLPTLGAVLPAAPSGYKVTFIVYLREDFKIQASQVNPTTIDTANPYFVVVFGKADDSPITPSEFIALNRTLRIIDLTKVPEITGSAYVGAGVTIRGDVKLIGDPYVNRVFDVNMWERGSVAPTPGGSWEDAFTLPGLFSRFRLKQLIPAALGDTISRTTGGKIYVFLYDANGKYTGINSGWVTSYIVPSNASFIGMIIDGDGLVTEVDVAAAGIKYVRAFEKRRYITNELDRTSPKDILLGPDKWGRLYVNRTAGKKYSELRYAYTNGISLNTPINVPASATVNTGSGYARSGVNLDALLVCLTDELVPPVNVALQGHALRKDPTAVTTPADVTAARLVIEFVPTPRITVPYGATTLFISGPKIRMYDNAVLSRNLNQQGDIVLQGDAVMGYDFNAGSCMCSNGHSDAIIKLP